jgi:hypothetical protein
MTTRRSKQPAHDLPDWIPKPVADVASRLPPSDIVARLLTDARMESVWRFLAKQDAISDAVLTMTLFDERMPPHEQSMRDRASAAVFLAIIDALASETKARKRIDVDAQAQRYFDAAKLCRETILDAEVLTNGFFEVGEALNFDLAKALDVIAGIFESRGDRIRVDNIDVIARSSKSRGDDALRIAARKIATTFFRFYGNHNYGLTAIVTSVATGDVVTKKSVANWCGDL